MKSGLIVKLLLLVFSVSVISCKKDDDNSASDDNSGNNNGGGNTTAAAHSCGAPNVHNPTISYGTMTDQEGNTYKTVVIGEQEWMAENLNTGIYRNGDIITSGLSDAEWENTIITQEANPLAAGAWSFYNNDSTNACPYGKLYNWYACVDPRGLCPAGWHSPNSNDWNTLISLVDPESSQGFAGITSAVAGGRLKTIDTNYWYTPNYAATNEYGFSALPGGYRLSNGTFAEIGERGAWWGTLSDGTNGANFLVFFSTANADIASNPGSEGRSIRCVKD